MVVLNLLTHFSGARAFHICYISAHVQRTAGFLLFSHGVFSCVIAWASTALGGSAAAAAAGFLGLAADFKGRLMSH